MAIIFLLFVILIIVFITIYFVLSKKKPIIETFELGSLIYEETFALEKGKEYNIDIDYDLFRIMLKRDLVKICFSKSECLNVTTKNLYVRNLIETYTPDRSKYQTQINTTIKNNNAEDQQMAKVYNTINNEQNNIIRNNDKVLAQKQKEKNALMQSMLKQIVDNFQNAYVYITNSNASTYTVYNNSIENNTKKMNKNILQIQQSSEKMIKLHQQVPYPNKSVDLTVKSTPVMPIDKANIKTLSTKDNELITIKITVPFTFTTQLNRDIIDNIINKEKKYVQLITSLSFTENFATNICDIKGNCKPYLFDSNRLELDMNIKNIKVYPQ